MVTVLGLRKNLQLSKRLGAPVGSANGLPQLPAGYVFYVDLDGKYLVDNDGNFIIGPA